MNRADLISYVTQKTQLIQSDDVTAAQLFLSKRYELIWNSYLWRDSLIMVNCPFDPVNNADNAEGILLLPQVINRVVAVRTNTQSVRVNSLEYYYRIDYDAFMQSNVNAYGSLSEFALLSPVWFVWRGAQGLQVSYSQPTTDSAACQLIYRDETGAQYQLSVKSGALIPSTETVQVSLSGGGYALGNGTYTKISDTLYSGPNDVSIIWVPADNSWEVTDSLSVVHYQTGEANFPVGPWSVAIGENPAPVGAWVKNARLEIESLFKPTTTGTVSLKPQLNGDTTGGTLQPTDLNSPCYQRLRLFQIPNQTPSINVLGKRPFMPLNFDQQIPELKNVDNCLIAFTCGDLLKRARQYGKAQQEYQEAALLLKELALLESVQASNYEKFVPESGFSDGYFDAGQRAWYGIGY